MVPGRHEILKIVDGEGLFPALISNPTFLSDLDGDGDLDPLGGSMPDSFYDSSHAIYESQGGIDGSTSWELLDAGDKFILGSKIYDESLPIAGISLFWDNDEVNYKHGSSNGDGTLQGTTGDYVDLRLSGTLIDSLGKERL